MSKLALIGSALCLSTAFAYAASNPLSVHVLNTQDGLPSPGVAVVLEQMKNGVWSELHSARSEEHTSELQSHWLISYAVFCLKKIFFLMIRRPPRSTLSLHDALPI